MKKNRGRLCYVIILAITTTSKSSNHSFQHFVYTNVPRTFCLYALRSSHSVYIKSLYCIVALFISNSSILLEKNSLHGDQKQNSWQYTLIALQWRTI